MRHCWSNVFLPTVAYAASKVGRKYPYLCVLLNPTVCACLFIVPFSSIFTIFEVTSTCFVFWPVRLIVHLNWRNMRGFILVMGLIPWVSSTLVCAPVTYFFYFYRSYGWEKYLVVYRSMKCIAGVILHTIISRMNDACLTMKRLGQRNYINC